MTAAQTELLEHAVRANPAALAVLQRTSRLRLASWYLGGGCVAQTVWNHLHGFAPTYGIKDYDVVYFDPDDLSAAGEHAVEQRLRSLHADLAVKLDVANEARVHLWYPERFGRAIPPYRSTEEAIASWPTTGASIGVRYDECRFTVCAPFGLADLFAMVIRPNKAIIDRTVYEAKAARWATAWPKLSVVAW